MKKILKIVKKYKIKLIEDCAHAIESKYKNKMWGILDIQAVIAFIQIKILQLERVACLLVTIAK